VPSARSSVEIAVVVPSEIPTRTLAGWRRPSRNIQTRAWLLPEVVTAREAGDPSRARSGGSDFPRRPVVATGAWLWFFESGVLCPSAANNSGVGWKRSAALGTRSTSSLRAISKVTFAVMPGFSFRSGLGTSITVV
jgi:hypothetical protein